MSTKDACPISSIFGSLNKSATANSISFYEMEKIKQIIILMVNCVKRFLLMARLNRFKTLQP